MNPYEVLGVGYNATQDDIRGAYLRLASKHHPDHGGSVETFRTIQVAYDRLTEIKSSKPPMPAKSPMPPTTLAPFPQRKRPSTGKDPGPNPLLVPALALLVSSTLSILLSILMWLRMGGIGFGYPVGFCAPVCTALGSIAMLRFKYRWLAIVGSAVAILPCSSLFWCGGPLFGYWAICLLTENRIKRRFR